MNGKLIRGMLVLLIGTMTEPVWSNECVTVNIPKQRVGIPDYCPADFCEIARSSAFLGPGEWLLEGSFNGYTPIPQFPFGEVTFVSTAPDTFIAKDGDRMYTMIVVVGDFNSPIWSGNMYVNGGTGRFADASGRLYLRADTGTGYSIVNGVLCGVRGVRPAGDD